GFCLRGCVSRCCTATRPARWRARINAGESFSGKRRNATRLANCRHATTADSLLARHFRSRYVDLRVGRVCALACRFCWLRKCDPPLHSLGDVHVDRPHRPDLVRLRLGDSAARDRFLICFSLPLAGWATISKEPATDSGDLAFSLAWV